MFDKVRHFITLKSNISDSHKYMKINIDSNDDLSLEKKLDVHKVVIPLNSIFNKSHDQYYYHMF